LKASRVIASVHVENIRSQGVLEKVGMKRTGEGVEFNSVQIYYEIFQSDSLRSK